MVNNDINYQNIKFVKSVLDIQKYAPEIRLSEIVIIGKSNVGKSSLINFLANKKIAKVSSNPGFTKYLNFFLVDNKYYLIDSPGYGFTKKKNNNFQKIMSSLFKSTYLKGCIFVLDSRRNVSEKDIILYNFLVQQKIPFFIVLSKINKTNQKNRVLIFKNINIHFPIVNNQEILILKKENLAQLKNQIKFLLEN